MLPRGRSERRGSWPSYIPQKSYLRPESPRIGRARWPTTSLGMSISFLVRCDRIHAIVFIRTSKFRRQCSENMGIFEPRRSFRENKKLGQAAPKV